MSCFLLQISLSKVERRNVESLYNKMSLEELLRIAPGSTGSNKTDYLSVRAVANCCGKHWHRHKNTHVHAWCKNMRALYEICGKKEPN